MVEIGKIFGWNRGKIGENFVKINMTWRFLTYSRFLYLQYSMVYWCLVLTWWEIKKALPLLSTYTKTKQEKRKLNLDELIINLCGTLQVLPVSRFGTFLKGGQIFDNLIMKINIFSKISLSYQQCALKASKLKQLRTV